MMSELVGVQKRMIQLITHPNGLIENQNGRFAGLFVSDCRCASDNGNIAHRFVRIRIRRNIAFAASVLQDDGITSEDNCVSM